MLEQSHIKNLSLLLAGVLFAICSVVALFWPSFADLHHSWLDSSHLSHGYILLPLTFYFLYEKRYEFTHHSLSISWLGLLLCIGISAAWFVAYAIDIKSAHNTIALFALIAVVYTTLGHRVGKLTIIPVGLVIFAAPIWGLSVPILQNITVVVNNFLLSYVDIPAHMEGNYISIASGTFFVAEGCSGYKYVITTVTLCVIFAYWNYARWSKRIMIVALGFALGVITNWIRVFSLIIIGEMTNMESSLMSDHEWYGWVLYGCMIIPLLYFAHRWQTQEDAEHQKVNTTYKSNLQSSVSPRLLLSMLLALTCISLGPALAFYKNKQAVEIQVPSLVTLKAPTLTKEGLGPIFNLTKWQSTFENADKQLRASYILNAKTIDWEFSFYYNQTQEKELINYKHFIADPKAWRFTNTSVESLTIDGQATNFIVTTMSNNANQKRVAFHTYNLANKFYTSKLKLKLGQIQNISAEKQYAFLLGASAFCQLDCSAARESIRALLIDSTPQVTRQVEALYSSASSD